MTRKEAYEKVKQLILQKEVEKVSGVNWTRTSTDVIETVINAALGKTATGKSVTKMGVTTNNPYEAACIAFVGILKDNGLLDDILAKL